MSFDLMHMYRMWRDTLEYGHCILELYEPTDEDDPVLQEPGEDKTIIRLCWFPKGMDDPVPMIEAAFRYDKYDLEKIETGQIAEATALNFIERLEEYERHRT